MGKIVYGQYDSTRYPLAKFKIHKIPENILNVMQDLNQHNLAIYRGGVGYIFLLSEEDYLLKDLDMIALETQAKEVLNKVSVADEVYINKNSFGQTVITAFWKAGEFYYKLDILMLRTLPKTIMCEYDKIEIRTVTASYLWSNRISKIAEKNIRNHTDFKTNNHYIVAKKISEYLIKNPTKVDIDDINNVAKKMIDMESVLSRVIGSKRTSEFVKLLNIILDV